MWLHTLTSFVLLVAVTALENCSPKTCKRNLDTVKPVCGSDGLTYPNRCHLERARCQNKNVTLQKRGICRDHKPCMTYSISDSYNFKPQCRADGTFAPSQCYPDTGFCWCVTPEGIPLPYTSVRWSPSAKPRCNRKKKVTRRRSQRQHKRRCKQHDKATFNNNLLKLFYTEWSRESMDAMSKHGMPNETDKVVLFWKFSNMDLNGDGLLDRSEYKDLQKMVRMAVRPKRCSKSFAKACDMNTNQIISRQEWAECLTRDGIDDGRGGQANENDEEDDEEEGEDPFTAPRPSPPHGVLSGETRGFGSTNGQNYDDDTSEIRDDEATDCLSDRQTALGEQHANKRYELYVPECTPDGRYQKIQCYKSAGYCWCVHEDTGKNIPGTSVKNGTPNCDQLTTVVRPMKGCPDEKKKVFIRDLMHFLHNRMATQLTNGTGITSPSGLSWKASKEEQAATWSFVIFDKNKNKMMDRNEWKAFKELMIGVKSLKRCGKKLPRYCDINKDRQISITEWLDCLNVQQVTTNSTPGSIRAGKNPLSVLIED